MPDKPASAPPPHFDGRRPLRILFSNDALIAIDKPSGLSVHEAPGPGGSILRSLREQLGEKEFVPAHRLDKDASGVLVLARSNEIAGELQRRWPESEKTYWALCAGAPAAASGLIDAPILENQTGKPERLRRALEYFKKQRPNEPLPPLPEPKTSAVHPAGRGSQTEYRVLERLGAWSVLELRPRQGRMHQIRVHLAHLGCPLAVDPLYSKRNVLLEKDLAGQGDAVALARLPLHAWKLALVFREERLEFTAPLPEDLERARRSFMNSTSDRKL